MDYEATDRDMSSWVVSCVKGWTRFYLTDDGLASDILSRARRYRWEDQAEIASNAALAELDKHGNPAWSGFRWHPASIAAMMAL